MPNFDDIDPDEVKQFADKASFPATKTETKTRPQNGPTTNILLRIPPEQAQLIEEAYLNSKFKERTKFLLAAIAAGLASNMIEK